MAAGPGDELEAGWGHLRASNADREQVIGTLKAAFVQGMLAKDELDLRVGQALASRTYSDLAALTADLPAGVTAARPPQPTAAPGEQPVARPGRVLTVATALYAGAWAYELFLSPHGGDNPSTPPLISGGFLVYLSVLLVCVGAILANRRDKRSGRQLPGEPTPGAGGQVSPCPAPADPGGLPPAGPDRRHTAEAAPIVRPRLLPS